MDGSRMHETESGDIIPHWKLLPYFPHMMISIAKCFLSTLHLVPAQSQSMEMLNSCVVKRLDAKLNGKLSICAFLSTRIQTCHLKQFTYRTPEISNSVFFNL